MSGFTSRNELLSSRLARLTRVLHGVNEGSVTAIHRTRVASRRLREVLPVLQLDSDVASKLSKKLKKVTRQLGPIRELDVLLIVIDELRASGRYPTRILNLVKIDVTQTRRHLLEDLVDKGSSHLRRAARKLGHVAAEMKAEGDTAVQARAMRWAIDARVARRAGALRKAIADAGQVYLAERLHAVRIALKKLRYGVELAVDAAGGRQSSDLKVLKRGQELLGRLHDLQVLIDRVRRVQGALAPPDLTVWRGLDALVVSLEQSCRRLHGRYMRERPAFLALCDKFGSDKQRARASAGAAVAARRTG
jgi:CHAD domain-containing protein